jgi:hypothetical protein
VELIWTSSTSSVLGQPFGFEHGDLLAAEHPVDGGFGLRPARLGNKIDLFAQQFVAGESEGLLEGRIDVGGHPLHVVCDNGIRRRLKERPVALFALTNAGLGFFPFGQFAGDLAVQGGFFQGQQGQGRKAFKNGNVFLVELLCHGPRGPGR